MNSPVEQILLIVIVIGCGLAIGRISIRGVSLGTCGVVFAALIAGHFGFESSSLVGAAGILIFAYCLGISAGPGFWTMFVLRGKSLLVMAVLMLFSAGATTFVTAKLFGLSSDLACGLLAGAMTSTPALAMAVEQLPADAGVTVGFGVAYPFGVVGVILFVQLAPRWFSNGRNEDDDSNQGRVICRTLVKVTNPNLAGKRLRDVVVLSAKNCQVSRVIVDGALVPIPASFELQLGQQVLVVGREARIPAVVEVLGEVCGESNFLLDVERQRKRVVVTSAEFVGKSLRELHLLSRYGVTISRIARQDLEFVPGATERIQFGDALTAIGEASGLEKFIAAAGHRERTLDETDLVTLAIGLGLGILVGRLEFGFAGKAISLGLAGGPLLVGLIFGGIGNVGPIKGRIPRAARFLLAEIGLALFLAHAGIQAGHNLVEVVTSHGMPLCVSAIGITSVPLLVGFLVAKYVLKLKSLETFGGICGAMTSTPGLGAVTSTTDSSVPATSYATVYPMALILITLLIPILIAVMR